MEQPLLTPLHWRVCQCFNDQPWFTGGCACAIKILSSLSPDKQDPNTKPLNKNPTKPLKRSFLKNNTQYKVISNYCVCSQSSKPLSMCLYFFSPTVVRWVFLGFWGFFLAWNREDLPLVLTSSLVELLIPENEPYQLILGRLRGTGMSWTRPLLGAPWMGSKFVSVFLGVSSWLFITSSLGPGSCRVCRWIPSFPRGLSPHNQSALLAHEDASLHCIILGHLCQLSSNWALCDGCRLNWL